MVVAEVLGRLGPGAGFLVVQRRHPPAPAQKDCGCNGKGQASGGSSLGVGKVWSFSGCERSVRCRAIMVFLELKRKGVGRAGESRRNRKKHGGGKCQ